MSYRLFSATSIPGLAQEIVADGCLPYSDATGGLLKTKPILTAQIAQIPAGCQAIRKHCLWCCGDQYSEVERCIEVTCPLFRFRFGMSPSCAAKEGKPVNPKTTLRGGVLYLAENS